LVLLYLAFQGLINGLFLTDDIFNLFVILEVMTLVMVLLNVFHSETRSIYDALYYLIIQIAGMAFFLLGVAFFYRATGVLSMTLIAEAVAGGQVSPQTLAVPFALLLAGLGMKVGLFPLFSFVPRFYGNPGAPISALMFSSSLICTASLYWIAKITVAFNLAYSSSLLLGLGFITAIAGAIKALAQRDIRIVLAFSTVSQAGLALMGLSAGSGPDHPGFLAHLFTHGIAKALLFLGAGYLIKQYGTADVHILRRYIWLHPPVAVALVIGALSLIGVPLTAGAVSKYWIMAAAVGPIAQFLPWLVTFGTTLVMAHILLPLLIPEIDSWKSPILPEGLLRHASRTPFHLTLILLTALVMTLGWVGPEFFSWLIGGQFQISWMAQGVKALQLAGVIIFFWSLHRFVPRPRISGASRFLASSFALPDSAAALAAFTALVLLAIYLPAVV
jgi:multicomponent Na+:H+ antiporter subunit D